MNLIPPESCLQTLRCHTLNDRRRIVRRALNKSWWVLACHSEDGLFVMLNRSIDTAKEIAERLPGIKFEVVS